MSDYFEEFWNNGTPYFDEEVDVLKNSLKKSIKEEVLNEIKSLREENTKLQEIKKNFKRIEDDYRHKQEQLESERRNLERTVALETLDKIFEKVCPSETVYIIHRDNHYLPPKCDKCDDKRLIHFKSPYGTEHYERCPFCYTRSYDKYIYNPATARKMVFKKTAGKSEISMAYVEGSGFYNAWHEFQVSANTCMDNKPFDEIVDHDTIVFMNEDKAKGFCDYINKKNNLPEGAVKFENDSNW